MSAGNAAQNYRSTDYARAADDWYVEPRWCVEQLADAVDFGTDVILDPCCGGGTIPEAFRGRGFATIASDKADRGYGPAMQGDFLTDVDPGPFGNRLSIVMNPPFKMAEAFVRHALSMIDHRLAILQQLPFLASAGRYRLFTEFPPTEVLILSRRPSMPPGHLIAEMGDKAFRGGTTDFCWIVWTKPHDCETRVRWLLPSSTAALSEEQPA